MKKNNIYKVAALSLGSAAAIIAPVATLVACGSKSNPVVAPNYQHDVKTTLELNDIPVSEYDVERNVLNTEAFGILPLSRIQHEWEAKDSERSLTKVTQTTDKLHGIVSATMMKHLQDDDQELIEHAKLYIDESVMVNNKPQSLTNPFKKFNINKIDIINNSKGTYEAVATQIQDFLNSNPGKEFSIFTHLVTEVTKSDKGFVSGNYEVRIYQKKANSADLNKAIALFKDPNKFGSDISALTHLQGFTFTFTAQMIDSVADWSMYSNYLQDDQDTRWQDSSNPNGIKQFKSGQFPRVFTSDTLIDSAKTVYDDDTFIATAGSSGSSLFQFGSQKGISDAELDFLDKQVVEVGGLNFNKKTNQVHMDITVTVVDNSTPDFRESGSKTEAEKNANYEKGSVATISIPLPLHTSWLAAKPEADAKDNVTNQIVSKFKFDSLYSGFLNLIQSAQNLSDQVFDAQSLVAPHLKMLLLDDAFMIRDGAKYSKLLQNKEFVGKLVDWVEKDNKAFDATTFNQVLTNFDEIPKNLGVELNSSQLYTFFAYFQIFYKELEKFVENDGSSYKDQLVSESAAEQLIKANNQTVTNQMTQIKTDYFDKTTSVDLKGVLFTTLDAKWEAILKMINTPDVGINNWPYEALSLKATNLVDNNDGTATVEVTVTPIIPTSLDSQKFNVNLTGVLGAKEIKAITDGLSTEIAKHTIATTNYDVKDATNSYGGLNGGFVVGRMMVFAKGKPSTTVDIKQDVVLSANEFKYIILTIPVDPSGKGMFTKPTFKAYDDFIAANPLPTGMEWAFKVQNLDVADATHPKWDLLVGLKDSTSGLTSFGTQTFKMEVK